MSGRTSAARSRSLVRWRAGLAISAVLVPFALFVVFERQARRLDALADHGLTVDAVVTATSREWTHYAYRVDGTEYTWNAARRDAPFAQGHLFPSTCLPEDPSFTRPVADRGVVAAEATRNRAFGRTLVAGLCGTLLAFAWGAHRDLRRVRSGAPSEWSDPRGYRRRIALTSILFVPLAGLVAWLHLRDAVARGESVLPVALAFVLTIAFVVGGLFFVAREGPWKARERAGRLLRWVVPVAVGVALVRLVAMFWPG